MAAQGYQDHAKTGRHRERKTEERVWITGQRRFCPRRKGWLAAGLPLLIVVYQILFCSVLCRAEEFELQTPHAVVMEVSTGRILFEKDADAKVHPASVTKVMTVLLIFEALRDGKIQLQDKVTTSTHAKSMGGSQVFLETGEIQTVETLLKCIIIASGNDAAVAMAEYVAGSEEVFVQKMNQRAKELGMTQTQFIDCCGLTDSVNHYTSAKDVALMSRELLLNFPQVVEYSDIWMEDITHVTVQGSKVFTLTNTNKLLRAYDGCDGLKTGSTSLAKFCLSATAKRNGIRMIGVVMTSPDSKIRFAEAANLLNYGFSRCSLYEDEDMGKPEAITVKRALQEKAETVYKNQFSYLSTTGEDFSKIEKKEVWYENCQAPLEKGAAVGERIYTLNKKEIGRVAIVTVKEVKAAGYLDCLGWLAKQWLGQS